MLLFSRFLQKPLSTQRYQNIARRLPGIVLDFACLHRIYEAGIMAERCVLLHGMLVFQNQEE